METSELNELLTTAYMQVCPKKKKRVHFRLAINDWLCQVIIDDIWGSAYFKAPPSGIPEELHDSIESATVAALKQALKRFSERE